MSSTESETRAGRGGRGVAVLSHMLNLARITDPARAQVSAVTQTHTHVVLSYES